jgi:hypothetical protein
VQATLASAASPSAASMQVRPAFSSAKTSSWRICGSSSTTRTVRGDGHATVIGGAVSMATWSMKRPCARDVQARRSAM